MKNEERYLEMEFGDNKVPQSCCGHAVFHFLLYLLIRDSDV